MIPEVHKRPSPPRELTILKHLQIRMNLPHNSRLRIDQLTKGFEGEKDFFKRLRKQLPSNAIILNNLLLTYNDNEFQIDTLIISENNIAIIEVKNYEGDFYIKDGDWFIVDNNIEIRNPLHQIGRCEHLLRKLLQQLGHNFKVTAYLIFINDKFTLYQAPLKRNIVFPTQLDRFINNFSSTLFKPQRNHQRLVKQLASRHLNISSNKKLPEYEFNQLIKGIICRECNTFLFSYNRKYVMCKKCGNKKTVESALLKSVDEYKLLFPNKKLTTSSIHEWCKIIKSKQAIRRLLLKHYKQVNYGKYAYYITPEE